MNRLSSNGPGRQHPEQESEQPVRPDILNFPFDLHAEDDDIAARLIEVKSPAPRSATGPFAGGPTGDDDFDHDCDTVVDDDGNDPPPANAGAALVIRAPRGPQPVVMGYTICAVTAEIDSDGEENFVGPITFLTKKKTKTISLAKGLAAYRALNPRTLPIQATHVVVNDETGEEVFRRPVLRMAS